MIKLAIFALASISLVDARDQPCSKNMYWDLDACQCLMRDTCDLKCEKNKVQDPREECACADQDEIELLYEHVGYDDLCKKLRPSLLLETMMAVYNDEEPETIIEELEQQVEERDETIEWLMNTVRELKEIINEFEEEKIEEPVRGLKEIINEFKDENNEKPEEIQADEEEEILQVIEPEDISCDFENYGHCLDDDPIEQQDDQIQEEDDPIQEEDNPIQEEEECALMIKDCPNLNFSVNKEKCECQCDLFCIATMSVDAETCTCKPIETPGPIVVEIPIEIEIVEPKPVEIIQLFKTCDADGNKICPSAKCMEGSFWDDKACICAPLVKCRKLCPPGQGLDPREVCSCIDYSEIDALYRCKTDQDIDENEEPEELDLDIVIEESQEPVELVLNIEVTEENKEPEELELDIVIQEIQEPVEFELDIEVTDENEEPELDFEVLKDQDNLWEKNFQLTSSKYGSRLDEPKELENLVSSEYGPRLDEPEEFEHLVSSEYGSRLDEPEELEHLVSSEYGPRLDEPEELEHLVSSEYGSRLNEPEELEHTISVPTELPSYRPRNIRYDRPTERRPRVDRRQGGRKGGRRGGRRQVLSKNAYSQFSAELDDVKTSDQPRPDKYQPLRSYKRQSNSRPASQDRRRKIRTQQRGFLR